MTKLFFITLLMLTSFSLPAAIGGGKINSSSWSLLYGYGQNVNEGSSKPSGPSYKFQLGNRFSNDLEANLFMNFADQKDDISYQNIEGSISRKNVMYGVNFGYWIFSIFKVHAGYTFHNPQTKISGEYTSAQVSSIKSNYKITDVSRKGLFAGADLVLLQSRYIQLFTNYDYYHLNHANSHDWDVMVGLRFYPGAGGSGSSDSSSSLFARFFKWITRPK